LTRHAANDRVGVLARGIAMFANSSASDPQLGVAPAHQVNCQDDLRLVVVDVRDDIVHEQPRDSLFQRHRVSCIPRHLEMLRQGLQRPSVHSVRCLLATCHRIETLLELLDSLQRRVPPCLELCRYQPLLRIDRFVASPCELCFVASLFELERDRAALLLARC